jgi:hypothetical protein
LEVNVSSIVLSNLVLRPQSRVNPLHAVNSCGISSRAYVIRGRNGMAFLGGHLSSPISGGAGGYTWPFGYEKVCRLGLACSRLH